MVQVIALALDKQEQGEILHFTLLVDGQAYEFTAECEFLKDGTTLIIGVHQENLLFQLLQAGTNRRFWRLRVALGTFYRTGTPVDLPYDLDQPLPKV
jgi:hypothetical protein